MLDIDAVDVGGHIWNRVGGSYVVCVCFDSVDSCLAAGMCDSVDSCLAAGMSDFEYSCLDAGMLAGCF
ncbi:hypothetical protein JTE90_025087 [Oedothorax gibbosus]|uniref:Uncharacterized protein n=1 Tax=Oedothorax gibbosus TaxID=931172 RepID=A0AAV6U0S1_9ARAC|nr:hypothetical protein JTE90_025087 [Oedothorax gibbosus]